MGATRCTCRPIGAESPAAALSSSARLVRVVVAAFKMDGDDGRSAPREARADGDEQYLASNRWDASDFVDPLLYDTRLTKKGAAQASLAPVTGFLDPKPEVSSPRPHRAMTTADLAFAGCEGIRKETCALMRERVFHASTWADTRTRSRPTSRIGALKRYARHADATGCGGTPEKSAAPHGNGVERRRCRRARAMVYSSVGWGTGSMDRVEAGAEHRDGGALGCGTR